MHEIPIEEIERLGLKATGDFEIIQHIELPQSPIYVTEHRLLEYLGTHGNRYFPHRPELKGPIFGARMLAMIGWLKSVGHCSYSTIETYLEDVLRVPVSRGYLAKLCTDTISESLATSYEEIKQAIPQQPQLGSDETSFKNNGKKNWIWCISSVAFSVFHIATTRSRDVLERLLGTEFAGYLNFDYFSANCSFVWNFSVKGQYCWAHLIREIRFLHPCLIPLFRVLRNPNRGNQAFSCLYRFKKYRRSARSVHKTQNSGPVQYILLGIEATSLHVLCLMSLLIRMATQRSVASSSFAIELEPNAVVSR